MTGFSAAPSTPPLKQRPTSTLDAYPIAPAAPHKYDKERQYLPVRAAQNANTKCSSLSSTSSGRGVRSGRISKLRSILRDSARTSRHETAQRLQVHFEDTPITPSNIASLSTPPKQTPPPQKAPTLIFMTPKATTAPSTPPEFLHVPITASTSQSPSVQSNSRPMTPAQMPTPSMPPPPHQCDALNDDGGCRKCARFFNGQGSSLAIRSYLRTIKPFTALLGVSKEDTPSSE